MTEDRYEFHPYPYEQSAIKRALFGTSLHKNGKCNYHPYEQEHDIRMASMDVGWLFNMSADLREFTLKRIHAAQMRLSAHWINWSDPKVLAEIDRREGTWVKVSPHSSEKRRPPDAEYWKKS